MQISGVYTVFDSKAGAFLDPFFTLNDALAIRMFTGAVNQPGHAFNQNPEDYTLFRLGEYYQETGLFQTEPPQTLGTALQYKDTH